MLTDGCDVINNRCGDDGTLLQAAGADALGCGPRSDQAAAR